MVLIVLGIWGGLGMYIVWVGFGVFSRLYGCSAGSRWFGSDLERVWIGGWCGFGVCLVCGALCGLV